MATEAWGNVRERFSGWFKQGTADAAPLLDESHSTLVEANSSNDALTADELRLEWTGRIRRILVKNPELAHELREIARQTLNDVPGIDRIEMHAHARDHGRVIQQGKGTQINF